LEAHGCVSYPSSDGPAVRAMGRLIQFELVLLLQSYGTSGQYTQFRYNLASYLV
jgi:hypothetical protein